MIKQLAHACIHAQNLAATEKFYLDTLGLEKQFSFMKQDKLFGFYIKLGASTFIEVFQGDASTAEGGIKHLAIEVEDMDKVISVLRENGYSATDKKKGADNSWQSWTEDPDGVKIEFHEYTDDSLQVNGGVAEVSW